MSHLSHVRHLTDGLEPRDNDTAAYDGAPREPVGHCPLTTSRHVRAEPERPSLLSPRQAAERLGVSLCTVYRLADRRALAVIRIGGSLRFSRSDLEAFIRVSRTPPRN